MPYCVKDTSYRKRFSTFGKLSTFVQELHQDDWCGADCSDVPSIQDQIRKTLA